MELPLPQFEGNEADSPRRSEAGADAPNTVERLKRNLQECVSNGDRVYCDENRHPNRDNGTPLHTQQPASPKREEYHDSSHFAVRSPGVSLGCDLMRAVTARVRLLLSFALLYWHKLVW